ncbi:MAG: nucleoside kinase [Prevotellaceae bacterium]|jgi:uridine kinase|nr:nucleoside kinase [Prevotellaceae bacterium]
MKTFIEITCTNTNTVHRYPVGTTLYEAYNDIKPQLSSSVIAAIVNNELKELAYELYNAKIVEFIDISHPDGMRTYIRSLTFLLQVAVKRILPNHKLSVQHSVSKGLYCEITNGKQSPEISEINALEAYMKDLITRDLAITKTKIPTSEAIELFLNEGYKEKALLLETGGKFFTSVYWLDNVPDHFYGPLVHSTGSLKKFGLSIYYQGVLLMFPKPDKPDTLQEYVIQNKMLQIFHEHKEWNEILGAKSIGNLNKEIQGGRAANLIRIAEALHEKKYAYIADKIVEKKSKIAFISGPSSSGKTTSAKRIAVQLQVAKKRPHIIELDNYFVNREDTPKDENGEYDFESLHAIDIELFNSQLKDLLEGKEVNIPRFDFISGTRKFCAGDIIKMDENDILIVEGIHGLNPKLISYISDDKIFRIYASALTSVSIDENNRIPTTDNRLVRRIVRDAATRGYSATDTIRRWHSVRIGEDRNIFPYQENADIMFNSSLIYELCVLRKYVEPLLRKVSPCSQEHVEALRLLKFIGYFENIDVEDEETIPPTSVLREFIGKSSFKY